ncbi:hypothetical protein [Planctomyces sp. SH-PL62]|uniref:hypothetical protein n=1 Tax=Planctomyces sp. SH-PL62 TaxID=1636152 RepID=UPI0008392625|nr:hypothetical protein [Planctomyces sp. SH-PL62]
MGRSRPRLAIAVAALILAVSARDSRAGGCHVPDRPILARSTSWDAWATTGPAILVEFPAAPAAFRPLPCEVETPSHSGRDVPPAPSASTASLAIATPPAVGSPLRPAEEPIAPTFIATPPTVPPSLLTSVSSSEQRDFPGMGKG